MSTRFAAVLAAVLACPFIGVAAVAAAPGSARPPASPLTDHFALRSSYFRPSLSTDGRFDGGSSGLVGTPFIGEDDFGLDDVGNLGRMELSLRMRERHLLRVDYLDLSRFGESTLTRPLNFRNQVFDAGDHVASTLDLWLMSFNYSFALLRRENFELGLGAGLLLLNADARSEIRARGIRETGTGDFMLPTLGVDASWAFHRRWSISGYARYLGGSTSKADGSFTNLHLDLQYRWKRNIALGLGYSFLELDAELAEASLPGKLAIEAAGPELFFRVSF
ncbi:MAG: hypothetical protein R3E75_05405 [Steroidobacteraceae bacterium]|nr:hypothetical protein [Nevskiaceae bacterium]MCP5471543.1 hypothetical protein [Nevskiaceae bacterium]